MAISDKLDYLIETKSKLKDSLNSLGAEITASTTFRNYINWLDNFYIGSANKTDLAKNGVVGRTSQNPTLPTDYTRVDYIESSGTQYIDTGHYPSSNNDELEIETSYIGSDTSSCLFGAYANGSYYQLNKTATANQFRIITRTGDIFYTFEDYASKHTYLLEGNKLYIDNIEIATGSGTVNFSSQTLYLFARNYSGEASQFGSWRIYSCKIKTNDILVRDFIPCYRNSDNEVGLYDIVNDIFYTNQGTGVFTYGSVVTEPSPDYPLNINNLSGDVEYKVRGKNLLPNNANSQTINGVTFTINEDKSITINGTATANSFFEFFNGNILLGNTITGIRKTTKSSPTQYPRLLLLIGGTEYNVDNVESHRNYRVFTGGGTLTRAGIGIQNGETYNETLYCMIIDGETTDNETYEPYISRTFPINLKSKNLFDKNNANIIKCGISYNKINASDSNRLLYISIQPNTTYTIQRRNDGNVNRFRAGTCSIVPANGVDLDNAIEADNAESITITSRENDTYLAVMYYRTRETILTEQQILDSIQIEESSTATTYEPYYDIELCNISDYKDRIYSQNGEFYLEKKTGKVVFDGSESWTINTSYTYNVFYRTLDNYARISNAQTTYCEYYKGIENAGGIANFGNNYNNSIGVRTANDNIKDIYISNNSITSASDFKTWLSTHNTVVYYVLATPTTTEITQENYPTLYSQLLAIQEFLTKYKINKEFLLNYSSLEIFLNDEIQNPPSESGIDWSTIGYDGTPQAIKAGYDYAKSIYDSWDSTTTSMSSKYYDNRETMIMPLVDTSNVTNMSSCFYSACSFSIMPSLNTSKVTNMQQTFRDCRALQIVPPLNTSKVTTMQNMFTNCYSLKTIPLFDTSSINSATSFSGMFNNCIKLTDTSLDNILQMCVNATGYPGTKTLYVMGIINKGVYPVSRIEALPHYQDFIDAGWTIGY